MRVLIVALAIVALTLPTMADPVMPAGADVWNGSQIAWRTRADGLAEAKRDGKVALIVVQADWCPVCRTYRTVFKDPKVVAASRGVVFILVNPDEDPEADTALAPDGTYVPRSLFVDGNGRILETLKSTNPQYRYYLDVEDAGELLALLKRARAYASYKKPG